MGKYFLSTFQRFQCIHNAHSVIYKRYLQFFSILKGFWLLLAELSQAVIFQRLPLVFITKFFFTNLFITESIMKRE